VFGWGQLAFSAVLKDQFVFVISCFQEEEVEHYTQQLEDLEQQVLV